MRLFKHFSLRNYNELSCEMKLKIVYYFLPMKTLLIHVELMTQTEITETVSKRAHLKLLIPFI